VYSYRWSRPLVFGNKKPGMSKHVTYDDVNALSNDLKVQLRSTLKVRIRLAGDKEAATNLDEVTLRFLVWLLS